MVFKLQRPLLFLRFPSATGSSPRCKRRSHRSCVVRVTAVPAGACLAATAPDAVLVKFPFLLKEKAWKLRPRGAGVSLCACLARFMPRVEIVQKHNTAARRLYIRGHNGKIYPYLVMNDACLTESRREERVLQLLRLLNPCLEKRKETTKRHLFFTGTRGALGCAAAPISLCGFSRAHLLGAERALKHAKPGGFWNQGPAPRRSRSPALRLRTARQVSDDYLFGKGGAVAAATAVSPRPGTRPHSGETGAERRVCCELVCGRSLNDSWSPRCAEWPRPACASPGEMQHEGAEKPCEGHRNLGRAVTSSLSVRSSHANSWLVRE